MNRTYQDPRNAPCPPQDEPRDEPDAPGQDDGEEPPRQLSDGEILQRYEG